MLPDITKLKTAALDLLFPKRCIGCGRHGEFLCVSCLKTIKRLYPPLCPLCGRPQINGVLCQDCIGWSAVIDGMRSPFRFDGVIREAIHNFKYKNLSSISHQMADLLFNYLTDYPLAVEVLVAVPLHPKRLRERGYNQSALLAENLGKICGLPYINNCLTRRRYTTPQAKTGSAAERKENVTGIFKCNRDLAGQSVLVIDDVATSGATLNACAQALKDSGAEKVWGLVLAREI